MKITPWEVSGDINYEKLIKQFGLSHMEKLPEEFTNNVLFRRNFVYAQRDFAKILKRIKNKEPFTLMTGLMPTGKFHIGHMILAVQMVFYQKLGAKCYIAVADIEAYHQRQQSLADSKKIALEEYLLNYAALGLDFSKCNIYFQSDRSTNGQKSNAYYRLQQLLARHATFNEFKAVYGEVTPGKIIASTLQAADMLHPQLPEFDSENPVLVPVGIDQDPHIRIARDMAKKCKEFKLTPLSSTCHVFIPGLKGGKMSSSDPTSFIGLSEDPKTIRNKVMKYAFSGGKETLEEHRKHGGNPDIDVSFQWLTLFEEDDVKLKEIEDKYRSGEILSGEMKQLLVDKLVPFLEEHQKKREVARKKIEKMFN
jgi:tryptophanyl-tRNA synthetase